MMNSLPSVDHLVAALQPAQVGHLLLRSGTVEIHDHVVLDDEQLQRAHHVPDDTHQGSTALSAQHASSPNTLLSVCYCCSLLASTNGTRENAKNSSSYQIILGVNNN